MRESRYNVWTKRGGDHYVFNGVSGGLLRMSSQQRAALRRAVDAGDAAELSPTLLKRLAAGRMIVADDGDEIAMLERRYRRSQADTRSFALTIVTSLGCNFDCPYCFEAKHHSLLEADVQQALLSVVDARLPALETLSVTWFGGEPLVGKRAVLRLSDELIARCEAAGVTYSAGIVTNGYFLDEATSRALRERRVTDVQVGLDGPPDVHDRMRPLRGGQGTFWRIIENLRVAVEHLEIAIRVNLDATNVERAEELLQILVAEGFAGKLTVYPGQLVTGDEGIGAPSATYAPPCLTRPEFAAAELAFNAMAIDYGFASPGLPSPSGAPCTAVRQNELVIGSKGEIYKCWDSVGNASEALGNIRDHMLPDTRLSKWLHYDPFVDSECRSCIALPVCMGGCAHHAMVPSQYDNRCGTFRHTYAEQVAAFVERAESRLAGRRDAPLQLIRRMETR